MSWEQNALETRLAPQNVVGTGKDRLHKDNVP